METRIIVSAVVKHKNKYLIAKRAASKKFAPNKWEFISVFVDTSESSEEIILRELKEELNINGKIMKKAEPYLIIDKEARWVVVPFLISVKDETFKLNKKDHSEARFVNIKEFNNYKNLANDFRELKKRKMI